MNLLTKSYRKNIIDNVYPSDLNKEDIKLGLKAKEELLNNITDEYVKTILPNCDEIEENIKKLGITEDEFDQYMNGEISIDKINLPKEASISVEVYAEYPETETSNIPNKTWSPYKETITFQKPSTWTTLKFRITISGDNFDKYYFANEPDLGMVSGWIVLPDDYNNEDPESEIKMDDVNFSVEKKDSSKISYITNNIKFETKNNSEISGIYLFNEWLRCDEQIPFLKVVSVSMTTNETY